MKKLIALLLALAMCLFLCACGKENDTSSTAEANVKTTNTNTANETTTTEESVKTTDTNSENETTPPNYASAFIDILCAGEWVSMDGSDELTFNENGTFSWMSNEEIEDWTWSFGAYYNSFDDFPLAVSGDFSEEHCIYLGYARAYDKSNTVVGMDDIIVGYTKENSLIMVFGNKTWIREE